MGKLLLKKLNKHLPLINHNIMQENITITKGGTQMALFGGSCGYYPGGFGSGFGWGFGWWWIIIIFIIFILFIPFWWGGWGFGQGVGYYPGWGF